ncbi:MAG: hypothetical protein D8M58_12655 [Calditrichaeota bacterium]|nr:MAG: hypothetical protein DWQ03_13440 [Calditrichota bacterium]MBL1206248.1 hypothetical protein [Calditrichota bacterium]NOG46074.1 hypothetical protein [Calditrichota bacterium]
MKNILYLILGSFCFLSAQVNIRGNLSTSLYSFESAGNENNLNFYQGLYFKVTPENNPDFYFKSNLRLIKTSNPSEWNNKVYNSHIGWRTSLMKTELRLGRQFVYSGVISGTMDALYLSLSPVANLNMKFVGGVVAPFDRKPEVTQWDDGNVLGAYTSYRFDKALKTDISYFQKTRNEELYWQQAGASFSGTMNQLFYRVKYDHNLLTSEYQAIRSNLTYYLDLWSFSAEYSSQRPRVYEDSFFSIFKIKAHNQIRVAATRNISEYQVGLQFINTSFEEGESSNQVLATLGNKWGILGLIYQGGYGGDNIGIYAEVKYQLLNNLKLNLHSSHYKYQRQSVQIDENATAFMAGLQYQMLKSLRLDLQLQESINNAYESDLRGLFRLNYSFKY